MQEQATMGPAVLALLLVMAFGASVLLRRWAAREWRKRFGPEMETDAQWWDTFQKRVRGS